ncbi:hypothetical protein J2805_003914 [Arthrobacter oryzae]|nr:hypothetical protein [Arthrobacter oryzae]
MTQTSNRKNQSSRQLNMAPWRGVRYPTVMLPVSFTWENA